MANQNLTEVVVILDESGSMELIQSGTVEGYNQFLADQKEQDGEVSFTLVKFNHHYKLVYDGINIQDTENLSWTPRGMASAFEKNAFTPYGRTALLDAIGKTIDNVGDRLASMPEEERPSKVIFAIITDGEENESRQFTRTQINKMITHQTEVYSWEFIFLAANQDAIGEGASLGIKSTHSMNFMATEDGMTSNFQSLSRGMSSYRLSGDIGNALVDGDQGAIKK